MPTQVRRKRQRSIRVLLALIFVVPLASLLALWGFAASVTLSNAIQEHNFTAEDNLYGGSAQLLGKQLAQERLQVFEWLSSGRRTSEQPMLAQFKATSDTIRSFVNGVSAGPGMIPSGSRPALNAFESGLNSLPVLRARVTAGQLSPLAAFQAYNTIVDGQFHLYDELVAVNDTPLYQQAAASVEAGQALEMGDREITLLSGAFADGGNMSKAERILFAQEVASQRLLMSDALKQLDPSLSAGYLRANSSAAYKSFAAIENSVVNSIGVKGPIPVNPLALAGAALPLYQTDYQAAEAQDRLALTHMGTLVGDRLLLQLGLAGGLGLIAVVLSVFLMVRFGRRISRELTGLQHAALDIAEERLPRVVARLSQGEEVDVAAEAAPPPAGRIVETARVAEALSSVQRTAVEAAVGQARLRAGVSQVFRNLAWRSQSLLHRQLSLLDAMERRSTEPETLDELFQIDHLTTRMRRHAEGLIILSGATPARGWREPVPFVDVLRGATAEVEDYKRVNVLCDSDDAVVGSAVADVIHLLAELIENATTYSPANTEVTVRAERVANGFAVEIEDRGIGIRADELATFNERLANPPEFDIADSNQLGLFVVARLAGKHHIRITLRTSPYGGTSAIVLLPHSVVVVSSSAGPLPIRANGIRELVSGPMQSVDTGSQRRIDGGPHFDVFRSELPAGKAAREDTAEPTDAVATGRLAPYMITEESAFRERDPVVGDGLVLAKDSAGLGRGGTGQDGPALAQDSSALAQDGSALGRDGLRPRQERLARGQDSSPWSGSSVWETGAGRDQTRPWLPRRVRQASLAPQLKTDIPAAAEAHQQNGSEDASPDVGDGPDPADTRALVQSLQVGLERARTTTAPDDDPWASPAGNPELAPWPEEPEGP